MVFGHGPGLRAKRLLSDVFGHERRAVPGVRSQPFPVFLNMREPGHPWIVDLIEDKYLWFEEYARDNGPSDRAFNGHIFAVYGLYDYWLLTGDRRAQTLADGGLTSVIGLLDQWRFPGGQSFYCLTHRERTASYHATHSRQLGVLYNLTAHPIWLALQDIFMDDYPIQVYPAQGSMEIIVQPGTYIIAGRGGIDVKERLEVSIAEQQRLALDLRGRLEGDMTVYSRVSDDQFPYMWFPEIPNQIYVTGLCEHVTWAHSRPMVARQGNIECVQFDDQGNNIAQWTVPFGQGDTVEVNERALIMSEVWMRLSNGDYGGYWVRRDDLANPTY